MVAMLGSAVTVANGRGHSPKAVLGDSLIIGTGHSDVNSDSSIGGGQNNTNDAHWATIGGGAGNTITGEAERSYIGGGSGNLVDSAGASVIGGGSGNAILDDAYLSVVCCGYENVISNAAAYAFLGGGSFCLICSNAPYCFIGAGEGLVIHNDVLYSAICGGARNHIFDETQYAFIGGGWGNQIGTNSPHCTVPGGGINLISSFNEGATIGGGTINNIETNSGGATIGGGSHNYIGDNAPNATIGGGFANQIISGAAGGTIPGGLGNAVYGRCSLAAGASVAAQYDGTFVWGDASTWASSLYTTGPNQFVVRASGGIWLGTNNNEYIPPGHFLETQTGAYLTSGGCWSTCSDRHAKRDFQPVNPAELLKKVAGLPLSSWSYRAEAPSVRHLGPVAQDFYAAFGLGEDERHISSVDEEGVALGALQGLYQVVKEKEAEVAALQKRVKALERQVATQAEAMSRWEMRLTAIERAATGGKPHGQPGVLMVSAPLVQ
jgi:hypothetical protein